MSARCSSPRPLLVIACGALAHDLAHLRRLNQWQYMEIQCLPAEYHNTPDKITPAVAEKIRDNRERYENIFIAYSECGTGGKLDKLLAEQGIERLPGAHCYEMFAGSARFAALHEAEAGTFYLTDFLAWHFQRLIVQGLGLDRHPELQPLYFGNYRRLVYLSQRPDPSIEARARAAARQLGLDYIECATGEDALAAALHPHTSRNRIIPEWYN